MSTISVAILGFGRVGASVALALRRYNAKGGAHSFQLAGYDSRPSVAKKVSSQKLVDDLANKAYSAVSGRDIVVIAMPYSEVKATYEIIGQDLRPGAVVLDASPIKQPSMEWARKYLPESAHLVGVTPVINPKYLFEGVDDLDYAHEDLFDKGSMLLMPAPSAIKDAVELAVDFSSLLGATPYFVDPAEHDGLAGATEGLPAILGTAAFYMFQRSPGWADGQRMINPSFGALTHTLFDQHPDDLRDLLLENRPNTLRALDEFMTTLHSIRAALAENDSDAVEAALVDASARYEGWLNKRHSGRWEPGDGKAPDAPSAMGEAMRGMMGSFLTNRLTGKRKQDDE